MFIHQTAIIGKDVKLAEGVNIGPYCVLDGNIEIGENTTLKSHVCISGNTKIGKNNTIYPFSSIGFAPQDKKYKNEITFVEIGDNNIIRESSTINSGSNFEDNTTKIGSNNLIMSQTHVAHDCKIGNNIILANGAMIAGHCIIEDNVIIGGLSGIHQFCHIGKNAMIGGMSAIRGHVLPFALVKIDEIIGVNIIGLKRGSFTNQEIRNILAGFNIIGSKNHIFKNAVIKLKNDFPDDKNIDVIIKFIEKLNDNKIGICPFNL
ncbi:acyl-ACP--UDP-N-acetylglucosamine O-acyltransferase [Candidatus Deianiraea vastatrix]|uniref:Acyl-[acyl-carrier-protein]--UDP-N-acetylglucosamine O-acyltransferase n=1 Tax=Candidatus Deianiraea vastatrix TaxID=2163644 RepID=A0A5B8XG95_9RICK|nr:acyl-ACP--UDP-N-acetylglucosamine O-acyltransferase [Candidatus Deianiraea vastatrix]QED23251.1 Acyl-[acyl-carrier-protein]--UDP-N-acetylglucosamine O-acyltransferase [Candidatus Deianiraea vastatrix]